MSALGLSDPLVNLGCVIEGHKLASVFRDISENKISTIIQLMHSFEVDIRICQPKNSDVHRGEAEVNITFRG